MYVLSFLLPLVEEFRPKATDFMQTGKLAGRIGIVDHDVVELNNLHRQVNL